MRRLFRVFCVACLVGALPASGSVLWQESFESVPGGGIPAGWADANGNNDFGVDLTVGYGSARSLRLAGVIGGCWAATVGSPIALDHVYLDHFVLELAIRNGSEALSGCHLIRGQLQMKTGPDWTLPGRVLFTVNDDGTLLGAAGGSGAIIGTLALDTWYEVRIEYRRISPTTVSFEYWLNGVNLATETVPAAADEDDFGWFPWESGAGTVWFDGVLLSSGPPSQDDFLSQRLAGLSRRTEISNHEIKNP
ncbi:MAG: hypothetical protein GY835_19475 [bacterium]|nr:hypothetical protein [bacterium]